MLVRKSSGLGLALAFTLMASCATAHAQSYAFTALGSLGGASTEARGINSLGQVVGYSMDASGVQQAVVWNGAVPTALADFGSGSSGSYAYAINNSGVIVGGPYYSLGQPIVWQNGTASMLPMPDGNHSLIYGINDSGQVTGLLSPADNNSSAAVIWNAGASAPTVLDGLGGAYTQGSAINNAGQVAGASMDVNGTTHAVIWNGSATPTMLADIDGLAGLGTTGIAISATGLVAGYSLDSQFRGHAMAWGLDGAPIALTDLGDTNLAGGVNSNGKVVGFFVRPNPVSGDSDQVAALWDAQTGQGVDLNSFLSADLVNEGIVLTSANAINDQGDIAGTYYNTQTLTTGAFKMSLVPEPGTYALFLMGLSGLGLVARRRRAAA